jgi:hypothetical protein
MTLQTALYTAKPQTTGGRESGAARTDDRRLDTEFTAAALSSALIFTAKWKKWYRVLRHLKGFGLFNSLRFGLWLARSGAGATPTQKLRHEVLINA